MFDTKTAELKENCTEAKWLHESILGLTYNGGKLNARLFTKGYTLPLLLLKLVSHVASRDKWNVCTMSDHP